jgi:hypothetical protein
MLALQLMLCTTVDDDDAIFQLQQDSLNRASPAQLSVLFSFCSVIGEISGGG